MHVDLTGPDWRTEVERVLALGATKVAEFDEYGTEWATLRDPDGNRLANQRGVGHQLWSVTWLPNWRV